MAYYRRGKALLNDDMTEAILDGYNRAIDELPEGERISALKRSKKEMAQTISDALDEIALAVRKEYASEARESYEENEKYRLAFEQRLIKKYESAIEIYCELLSVCLAAVDSHREIIHSNIGEKDKVFPVILRLHARVTRMANEILSLVRSGYGSGALSRWRSMHETTVVLAYLIKYGGRAVQALKDHEAVSTYKAMKDYQLYHEQLNAPKYSAYEMSKAKRKYERRIRKYGRSFKKEYGWAEAVTPAVNNFRMLEKHVGIDHLRPYYKLSSVGIHMEWNSLLSGEEFKALEDDDVILVGPADYGFYDALSLSMITLSHATTMILTYNGSVKSTMYCKVIRDIQQEGEDKLINLHQGGESE